MIAKAKMGLLPPHQQLYIFREMAAYQGTSHFPDNGDVLLQELRECLLKTPQISDYQAEQHHLFKMGLNLLFYFSKDYGTILEIAFSPDSNFFTCCISIDLDLTPSQFQFRISEMQQTLLNWIQQQNISFDINSMPPYSPELQKQTYSSLDEVLRYLFSLLRSPELLH